MDKDYHLTGGFSSLGQFAVAVRKHIDGDLYSGKLDTWQDHCRKTMTEATDSQGGYLVPEKWAKEIYSAAIEDSIVRSRAIIQKMTTDTLNIPTLVDSDRSSNIFGGITFTWLEEAAEKGGEASDPTLGNIKLTAHKGAAITFVSNELEDDAINFGNFIKLAFGKAVRFYEDDYFIHGSGVGQPLGVMASGYLITPNRQQANQIKYEDIWVMVERLLPGSWDTAIFLLNSDTLEQILSLDVVEAGVRNIVDVNNRKLFGFPFTVTEKCQALGTAGDIILADFKNGYVIGDRSMEIAGSRHFNYSSGTQGFLKDTTCWRIVLRVDGQPVLSSPITPKYGGNTLSSFVALSAQVS